MKAGTPALAACLAVAAAVAVAGCGGGSSTASTTTASTSTPAKITTKGPPPKVPLPKGPPPKGLVVKELKPGHGPVADPGDELTTQFVAVRISGKRFESSWEQGREPFSFKLGADQSSPGWEHGLPGMRVGGRRELIIPPRLSSRFGTPPGSSPEDTLVYVIELLAAKPPPGEVDKPQHSEPKVSAPSGPPPKKLIVRNLIEGKGPAAERGDEVTVEYVGIHYDGSPFTNSWERSKPFKFTLGSGSPYVNPGWEKGIPGMKVGGRRELIVPPKLLYRGGAPPGSKPADTLVYVIDLVAID